jgi:hypothetical protein
MPAKNQKKRRTRVTPTRTSEVLDVKMAAELLTVSPDTVYDGVWRVTAQKMTLSCSVL